MVNDSLGSSDLLGSKFATRPSECVAYIMSRFPVISETFVLYEMLELQKAGLRIEIFPLIHQDEKVVHPEVESLVKQTHYTPLLSTEALSAQFYWLWKRPKAYLRIWWRAIFGNVRSPNFLVRAVVVVLRAATFARRIQALDVTHVHAHWATHPTLAAYVIHQLTGITYSFTAHADDIYVDRAMLGEKIREASFVVTISEYNRQFLKRLYGTEAEKKLVIVRYGVDFSVFNPPSAKSRSKLFTIICVARLEEKKGHSYLIEACARLKAQSVPFRCLFVGDGKKRREVEIEIARSGLADHIILLGRQPRNRVQELLAEADVFVLSSVTTAKGRQEGLPNVLVEALAVSLPVVATSISGTPELVIDGQTGLLVPPRDAQAIEVAILKLYRDPELGKRLALEGRAKVLREFDLAHNVARLHRLFTQDWSLASVPAFVLPVDVVSEKVS